MNDQNTIFYKTYTNDKRAQTNYIINSMSMYILYTSAVLYTRERIRK